MITGLAGDPFPDDVRRFVDSTRWTFAKTYAHTWPHEYVVRIDEHAGMLLAPARHIFEHGTDGRFYSQVRKYHREDGKVYWAMAATPEEQRSSIGAMSIRRTNPGSRRGLCREREGQLAEAPHTIQWDYKNLVRRKGRLERLK